MKLQPLAAEFGLDAAFVTGLVTNLIAALRQRGTRNEDNGQQCERAPLHCFLGVFRAVRRFATAFFAADFFGGAGVLAAVVATAKPGTVLRRSFRGLGAETAATSAGCGDAVPRRALVTAAM
jgi:hypothetical protein